MIISLRILCVCNYAKNGISVTISVC